LLLYFQAAVSSSRYHQARKACCRSLSEVLKPLHHKVNSLIGKEPVSNITCAKDRCCHKRSICILTPWCTSYFSSGREEWILYHTTDAHPQARWKRAQSAASFSNVLSIFIPRSSADYMTVPRGQARLEKDSRHPSPASAARQTDSGVEVRR